MMLRGRKSQMLGTQQVYEEPQLPLSIIRCYGEDDDDSDEDDSGGPDHGAADEQENDGGADANSGPGDND